MFKLTVETEGREVYGVEAGSTEEARSMFDRGDLFKPLVSEVLSATVVSVEVETDGNDQ